MVLKAEELLLEMVVHVSAVLVLQSVVVGRRVVPNHTWVESLDDTVGREQIDEHERNELGFMQVVSVDKLMIREVESEEQDC